VKEEPTGHARREQMNRHRSRHDDPTPVLLVAASTFPSRVGDGTPGFVLDLAKAVAPDFRQVVVVAPMVPGARRDEVMDGIVVHRFSWFPARWQDLAQGAIIDNLKARPSRWLQVPFFLAAMGVALATARRRHRPDVAHLHWIIPQGVVGALVLGRLPRVVTTLGGDLYALRHPLLQRLKGRVVRTARFVTCMSTDMAAELSLLGAPDDRVAVLPMGVDVGPIERAVSAETRRDDRVLFVGRLVEKKGAGVLLDAVERMTGRPDVVVVGDGPLRSSLARRAPDGVVLVGSRDKDGLAAEYARAAVAVYPSVPAENGDRDGLPVALLEAMAAGCAVVCSSVPGIVDVVEDGVDGLLVPPGDAAALATAIQRLLDDPVLRGRLGASARTTSEAHSVEAVSRGYRQLLLRALEG
jgi:colanic acid/amylovoran biosynthesis glycosyltransferase